MTNPPEKRQARFTLRRFLTPEVTRQGLAVLLAVVPVALVFWLTRISGTDPADELLYVLLLWIGCYGPAYFALSAYAFWGLTGEEFRAAAVRSTPSRLQRMLLGTGAPSWAASVGICSLTAVAVMLIYQDGKVGAPLMVSALVCIVGSWVLLCGVFTLEYARLWASQGALSFPDGDDSQRRLGDFVYTSVQLSTTFSGSDVALLTTRVRRAASVHAITAFVFSSVILGMVVSLLL